MHDQAQQTKPATTSGSPSIFRLDGEYWTIAHAGTVCRLRDTAGLRYLAYLLEHPGERISARHLLGIVRAHCAGRRVHGGGRSMPISDADELARVKVTRAIRAALERIGVCSASLIAHLRATVKTGSQCSYTPDPRLPVHWEF